MTLFRFSRFLGWTCDSRLSVVKMSRVDRVVVSSWRHCLISNTDR